MKKALIEIDIPDTEETAALYLNTVIKEGVEFKYLPHRMLINDWCRNIHRWAIKQGFYETYDLAMEANKLLDSYDDYSPIFLAQRIALMHSEVTEVLEAVRNGDDVNELEEVADVVIRMFDYAEFRGFALEQAIAAKMAVNEKRPHKHGKAVF